MSVLSTSHQVVWRWVLIKWYLWSSSDNWAIDLEFYWKAEFCLCKSMSLAIPTLKQFLLLLLLVDLLRMSIILKK